MSTTREFQAADIKGPFNAISKIPREQGTEVIVINVADAASHVYDVSSATYFNSTRYQSRFVRIISEGAGDIWYYWSSVNTDTVSKTATDNTAGTVPGYLPSKVYSDEVPSGQYLVMQAAQAGIVRIWISSHH